MRDRPRFLLALLLITACQANRSSPGDGDGTLSVRWSGATSGIFAAPAVARWCAMDTLLEIIAVRGDTAVGLILVAQDSVRKDIYRANDVRGWTSWRPQASAGLRWVAPLEVKAFESYGGQVEVTTGGTRRVGGTFELRMRPPTSADTVLLKGSFSVRQVQDATPPCGRANRRPFG